MNSSDAVYALSGTVAAAGIGALALRWRAYRREVPFDGRYDSVYDFSSTSGNAVSVEVTAEGFSLPEEARGYDTGFLELALNNRLRGHFVDPSVELSTNSYRNRCFLERGAEGVRHIDISPFLLRAGLIRLHGRHIGWETQRSKVRLWSNAPLEHERVMVVAPHPDDAEIAAHGLYEETGAYIVTICAGDRSDWNLFPVDKRRCIQPALVARLRAWDSMTVPQWAGIPKERLIQLAYPDSQLAAMNGSPATNFCASHRYDFAGLRRLNQSCADIAPAATCSWESLIRDLQQVLVAVRPTVIVLPYPKFDNHPDHGFATVAVCAALRAVSQQPSRLLLYVNHCLMTEHWPFGPAKTLMSLPPNRELGFGIHALWSRPLSDEAQLAKLVALESMHDLRDFPRLGSRSWPDIWNTIRSEVGKKLQGMERNPNSYFRRGVRASELFFVSPHQMVEAAAAAFVFDYHRARA